MGIASIPDYPLPGREDLPPNRVDWRLDKDRAALLVHDMQRYFLAPFGEGAAIAAVVANIARLLAAARAAGVPVFYTAQKGDQRPEDRGLQADFWGPGMKAMAEHEEIVAPLAPVGGDIVLQKHRYSAFQRSEMGAMMAQKARDQLVICGVYSHIGCVQTAFEAFQRDIQPFFVADAGAAFSRRQHDAALETLAHCCGVTLITQDALEALSC